MWEANFVFSKEQLLIGHGDQDLQVCQTKASRNNIGRLQAQCTLQNLLGLEHLVTCWDSDRSFNTFKIHNL